MIEHIGRLGAKPRRIALDGRDGGLDGLLAELLGAFADALGQKLARIGTRVAVPRPLGDGRGQPFEHGAGRAAHGSSLTATPASASRRLASATLASPKWKIEAASTALAWPSRTPSTRCSSVPTPPEAMTGTVTASAMARVSARS